MTVTQAKLKGEGEMHFRHGKVIVGVALAMLVFSCGSQTSPHSVSGTQEGSSNTTPPVPNEPSLVLVDGRLAATFTYDSGAVRFEPPPPAYEPRQTAADAYAIFSKSDAASYSSAFTDAQPQEFLADYTTIGAGPGVDMDPDQIGWDHLHSWVIRFTDIPSGAAGPGVPPDSTETPNDHIYHEDVVVVINAETGQILSLYNALPDTQ